MVAFFVSVKEVFFMDKKISAHKITFCAVLVAISVIIGIFCKNFMNFGGGLFRVTFENLPIIFAGILFGPLFGGLVGGATDFISYLLSAQIYPPNLIVTFGAVMIGVVAGLVPRIAVKKRGTFQFVLSEILAHLVGSVIIKSIGLYAFYGIAVLWRIPLYAVIMLIEVSLIILIYKNSNFKKLIDSL
jgi:ECF transporter S component (folate family)